MTLGPKCDLPSIAAIVAGRVAAPSRQWQGILAWRDDFVFTKLLATVIVDSGTHTHIDRKPLTRMAFIDAANRAGGVLQPAQISSRQASERFRISMSKAPLDQRTNRSLVLRLTRIRKVAEFTRARWPVER